MVNWNTDYPAAAGLQFWPTIGKTYPVAAGQPSLGARIPSLATENIGALRLGMKSSPSMANRVFTLVDIYPAGSEVGGALQVTEYAPNADAVIGNWTTDAGGVVNLFARIDDAVTYPPTGTDYIRQIVGGASAYRCEVGTAAFPAGARVCRLSIRAVIGVVSLPGTAFVEIGLFHAPSSTVYDPPGAIVFTNGLSPNYVLTLDCGEINPVTLLPWTPADVQSFDTPGNWHLRVAGAGTGSNGPVVTAMALRVSYLTVENRAAVATYRRPTGSLAATIETDALVALPGAGTWSKTNAVTYTYVPRVARDRLVGGTAPQANDLALRAGQQDLGPSGSPAGVTTPPAGFVGSLLNIDEHGLVTSAFAGDQLVAARIVPRTTAPADSNDGQAYVNDGSTTVLRAVTAANPAGQRLTTTTGPRSYLGVRLLIAPPASGSSTLTVGVFTGGGAFATPVGGTLVFTADQVRALPEIVGSGGLRYLEGFLSSVATLANATAYEVRATPSAGTWTALVPSGVGAGGITLGGTTWFAQTGGGSQTEQDMAIMLLEQPAAPTAVTAQVLGQLQQGDGCFCTIAEVDQVVLDWTGPSPALAGTFARYEIERDEDDGRGFLPVWWVTSAESLTTWTDYEMPMDRPVKYRVRAIATTLAFSAWEDSEWVTCLSRGAEVVFTSNHQPGLQLVYDHDPRVPHDFPDHASDVVHRIYGSDGQVTFFDPHDRGMSRRLRITANFGRPPVDSLGRQLNMDAIWEPLRSITRSTAIPYICVRQPNGVRTFAHVTLADGESNEPGWRYNNDAGLLMATKTPTVGTS